MSNWKEAVDYRKQFPIVRPANLDRTKYCDKCLESHAMCECKAEEKPSQPVAA